MHLNNPWFDLPARKSGPRKVADFSKVDLNPAHNNPFDMPGAVVVKPKARKPRSHAPRKHK